MILLDPAARRWSATAATGRAPSA